MDAKTIEEQTAAYQAKLEADMARKLSAKERMLREQAEKQECLRKAQAETMVMCPQCMGCNIYAEDNGEEGGWIRTWLVCDDCGATSNSHHTVREAFREWEQC